MDKGLARVTVEQRHIRIGQAFRCELCPIARVGTGNLETARKLQYLTKSAAFPKGAPIRYFITPRKVQTLGIGTPDLSDDRAGSIQGPA